MNGIWFVTKLAVGAIIIILVIYGIAEVIKWRNLTKKRNESEKNKGPLFNSEDDSFAERYIAEVDPYKSKSDSQERCVFCGRFTPYKRSTSISEREYYIEGAGQLCKRCYEKTYGNS